MKRIPVLLCLVLSLPGTPARADGENPQQTLDIVTAQGSHHFTVEVPESEAAKEKGLMFRTALAADHGMLFYWSKPWDVQMWMKNTFIPLDMLFIDAKGRITYIAANATPKSLDVIRSGQQVSAVIELAGGTAAADHIHTGDKVIHAYFRPPS